MIAGASACLEEALKQRVLMVNVGTTNPEWRSLTEAEWGGPYRHIPTLNVTRADLVLEWAMQLLAAGADILEAPSLGADRFTAGEVGANEARRREWTRAAVQIARQATAEKQFIIGAVGPSLDLLTFAPRHSFEQHVAAFAEQIRDLWNAHVDAIHLAFHLDSKNLQAALRAVISVQDDLGSRIPIMITLDLSPNGTIASGERPEELWGMLREYKPIAVGLVTYGYGSDTVRRLRNVTDIPIGFLVDPFPYAPPSMKENKPIEWLAECLGPLLEERLLSFCGLSCTVPSVEYVKTIAAMIQRHRGGHDP